MATSPHTYRDTSSCQQLRSPAHLSRRRSHAKRKQVRQLRRNRPDLVRASNGCLFGYRAFTADHHALSIGMTTVRDQACFGIYADRTRPPDAAGLAHDIDEAIAVLLVGAHDLGSVQQAPLNASVRKLAK